MLQVHSSNQLEKLLLALITTNAEIEHDPFVPETVVVQNSGMARWVSQQIAELQGISANLHFQTPGAFIWEVARYWFADLPITAPHNKTQLAWQIYALLPGLLSHDQFKELNFYLANDNGQQSFQLAQQIAGLFDQYLIYRPDMILDWEAGTDDHWQAQLWRAVCKAEPASHWGSIKKRLASIANTGPALDLPKRISVFGVSDMPPLYTDILRAVSNHTSVCIYYLNPCREYWADIEDERQQSRRRTRARQSGLTDPTGLLDVGNPLLASWGHAGQAFLDQLIESELKESDDFVAVIDEVATSLQQLQIEILELQDSSLDIKAADQSLQIHSAHSYLREVQILHDQLLHLFETHPGLRPRDIIVMAPDIDRYAPFIDATFSTALNEQHIPWSISDQRLRSEQQLLESFNALLHLPESRFESTEILALLDMPAVRRRFSIELNNLRSLRQWVRESGIRWSLNAAMREEIQLPPDDSNSWSFGLNRLFLGFALPDQGGELYEGIAPYADIEGSQSDALQVLQQVVDLCAHWRNRLQQKHSPQQWLQEIDQLINAFYEPDENEALALQTVRSKLFEAVGHANAAGLDEPLSRDVITELLHGILEDNSSTRSFLTGRVTFSNMVPMRSIPFRVVCILGLNSEDFPRKDRPLSFDLMAEQPRRGDRRRPNDDRYLFLETVLSARDVLYLSYVGHDVRDNSEKAPSTVLKELIDYTKIPVIEHPLQPFSRRYFNGQNPALINYRSHWFDAAQARPITQIPRFIHQPLLPPDDDLKTVELQELITFYQRPAASFLQARLEVKLGRSDDVLEDTEPFALDGLQTWQIKQATYQLCNRGDSKQTAYQKLMAYGDLPAGDVGRKVFNDIYEDTIEMDRRVLKYKTPEIDSQDFELQLPEFNLYGHINEIRSGGLFDWWFGQMRVKDLLKVWIRHLALCHLSLTNVPGRSVFVCQPYTVLFNAVEDPADILGHLLDVRWCALESLYPLFPAAGLAKQNADGNYDWRLSNSDVWRSSTQGVVEKEMSAEDNQIVWRGQANPFDEKFDQFSQSVFSPLIEHATFIAARDDN